ncbi:hypothetical protein GCM10023148_39300 [Actinokineospora soli]
MSALDDALAGVEHPREIDGEKHPEIATALYDWADRIQPRSRNAKALAEPYLHDWLVRAADAGTTAAKAAARRVIAVVAAAVVVLSLLLLLVGG